jgi:O-antigen/teichoic acid export membrane protein
VFATVKWLLLYMLLPLMPDDDGSGLLAAWVAGIAVSMLVLAVPSARRMLPGMSARPDWAALRSLRGATLAHNAFNLAGQMPRLLLPVMATTLISPRAGAAFFIAWMVVGFLYTVPTHLSTALFAIGAGRLEELGHKLPFSFGLSLVLGAVGGPLLAVLAPRVLGVFGDAYTAEGATALRLLCLAYLPMVVKTHYVAVVRVQRNLARGSLVALLGAALELVGAAVGAVAHGVLGLSVGLLVGLTVEAAIMVPTLLGVGLWQARHTPTKTRERGAGVAVRRSPASNERSVGAQEPPLAL